MLLVARIASTLALAATILPPVLFLRDAMGLEQVKVWMTASAIVWFATAPLWLNRGAQ